MGCLPHCCGLVGRGCYEVRILFLQSSFVGVMLSDHLVTFSLPVGEMLLCSSARAPNPCGLGKVLVSQGIFGNTEGQDVDEAFFEDGSMRFFFSLLGKSGWFLSLRVAFLPSELGSPGCSWRRPISFSCRRNGLGPWPACWPFSDSCAHFVPINVASKLYVASLEAPSSRRDSAS